ncbi:DUF6086 family protein [Streptomyces rubellomurinus]|uniref:Uncharacterized protein n=1 Tax=Streptomyces rubellomurinus (strain ATCC 31215) TaxID=359131 RepID=A0A0F2TE88_STRR3|nr:DUF6086 family protein [Streptomyces rubellomurinus]KJS61454.1 hypothetical protein VM95_14970 [Streptomyces rubellomurinus]
MSQYYELGEETLWNPANGASRLFLQQLAVFEAEIGLRSGIGPMEADECQIDPAALEVFANALLAWHRGTHHAVIRALSEGFAITVLALAERAGVEVHWETPRATLRDGVRDMQVPTRPPTLPGESEDARESQLREKVQDLASLMAR